MEHFVLSVLVQFNLRLLHRRTSPTHHQERLLSSNRKDVTANALETHQGDTVTANSYEPGEHIEYEVQRKYSHSYTSILMIL